MQESINKACANAKKVVAYNHERYIALLATENKQKGIFEDFYVQIGQELRLFSFPSWINDSNPSFAPKIFYHEPNQYVTSIIDIEWVGLTSQQIFDDVVWELMTHYQLEGDQLVAEVGGRVTLSHFIGEMKVTYCFKDGKYKVNSMQFHPIDYQALCNN